MTLDYGCNGGSNDDSCKIAKHLKAPILFVYMMAIELFLIGDFVLGCPPLKKVHDPGNLPHSKNLGYATKNKHRWFQPFSMHFLQMAALQQALRIIHLVGRFLPVVVVLQPLHRSVEIPTRHFPEIKC